MLSSASTLDAAWIAAHIPHHGRMCLLDAVLTWDAEHISCRSLSHRAADHPLRARGRLGAACGVEYAAQAMAIHGVLLSASQAVRRGLLASVRDLTLGVDRLDDIDAPLNIRCARRHGDTRTELYDFQIQGAGRLLLQGRAAIVLEAPT